MSNYHEWLERAEHDLQDIRNNLSAPSFPADTVSFHAYQAVEKTLKALCLSRGSDPGKTHDLVGLLKLATTREASLAKYAPDFQALNIVYLPSRYPVAPMPTAAQARHFAAVAENLFVTVKVLIK